MNTTNTTNQTNSPNQTNQNMSQIPLACLNRVKRTKVNGAWSARARPLTHQIVEAIVDRSGSMGVLWTSTSQGMDNFLHSQRRIARKKKIKTLFSLTTFDDVAETYYDKVDLASFDLPLLDADKHAMFYPRGFTLLRDTLMHRLCAASRARKELLASMTPAERDDANVGGLILINTDGEDNQSRLFTADNIDEKVTQMKADGFTFTFMAANQDALRTAAAFGIGAGAAITFAPTPQANEACWRSAVANAAAATTTGAHVPYTKLQRDSSCPASAHAVSAPAPPPAHAFPAPPPRPGLNRAQTGLMGHARRCAAGNRLHRPPRFPMHAPGNIVLPLPVIMANNALAAAMPRGPPRFPPARLQRAYGGGGAGGRGVSHGNC